MAQSAVRQSPTEHVDPSSSYHGTFCWNELLTRDIERAKQFYAKLGWRLDADFAGPDDYRVIQFTPPGSNASVIFGKNVTSAAPGSAQGLYLVVSDIEAARNALLGRGVAIALMTHRSFTFLESRRISENLPESRAQTTLIARTRAFLS